MPRSTKIVATLGPACSKPDVLRRMLSAGVDVVRLNFSHGSARDHVDLATLVRETARALDMVGAGAVREVEAYDVDAGGEHAPQDLRVAAGGTERGDDFRGAEHRGNPVNAGARARRRHAAGNDRRQPRRRSRASRARSSSTSIAGSLLPSRNSRNAPPPVEM